MRSSDLKAREKKGSLFWFHSELGRSIVYFGSTLKSNFLCILDIFMDLVFDRISSKFSEFSSSKS